MLGEDAVQACVENALWKEDVLSVFKQQIVGILSMLEIHHKCAIAFLLDCKDNVVANLECRVHQSMTIILAI